jgi:hypothetical protein
MDHNGCQSGAPRKFWTRKVGENRLVLIQTGPLSVVNTANLGGEHRPYYCLHKPRSRCPCLYRFHEAWTLKPHSDEVQRGSGLSPDRNLNYVMVGIGSAGRQLPEDISGVIDQLTNEMIGT